MKFITEYDLRTQFNKRPFTNYRLEENVRLTPSARQFLIDQRIHIWDGEEGLADVLDKDGKDTPELAKLVNYIEILEAEFLVVISQIMDQNLKISEQIMQLKNELSGIRLNLIDGKVDSVVSFDCCPGINEENCCQDLDSCFEIKDFHIQLSNGKLLAQMNFLRAKMRLARIDCTNLFADFEDEKRRITVIESFNRIINKLSQLMCTAAGVQECRWAK